MSTEIAALAAFSPSQAGAAGGGIVQVGYGVSLSDIGGFQRSLEQAAARLDAAPVGKAGEAAQQVLKPFEHINAEATRIAAEASAARNAGREMTPSEVLMLTVRAQEFMFHCQLTSNIANRTSEGLQQLFRQQS